MLNEVFGEIWKRLPRRVRLKIIRVTQKKFTASVAVIITNPEGKVLLLEHYLRPASGWGIPGGFIGANEQPEEAIRRELREETGLELENLKMLRARITNRHIEMLFRAETNEKGEVKSREIRSLGWFAPDKLPTDMNAAQKATIEKVLKGEI